MSPPRPQYLLFTSLVKHGDLLRYILATQVRKRLMEPYGFHRQVKSSALTGNPPPLTRTESSGPRLTVSRGESSGRGLVPIHRRAL